MEGTARYAIKGAPQNQDDISMTKGQKARLLQMKGEIWEVEVNGKVGFIPSQSLEMRQMQWYYGNITSKEEAFKKLSEKNKGFFLVHNSSNNCTNLFFSFIINGKMEEFQIFRELEKYYIFGVSFLSVNEAVNKFCPNGYFSIENVPTKSERKKLPPGQDLLNTINMGYSIDSEERITRLQDEAFEIFSVINKRENERLLKKNKEFSDEMKKHRKQKML